MSKIKIIQEGESYTFRSYFEMSYEPDEILAELGYSLIRGKLAIPQTDKPINIIAELQQRIEDTLPFISLSSEAARRETLVAPVLLEVVRYCQCQLRIEYPLKVNNWLKGNLDYLLKSSQSLIVVEAKHDDLSRGFTQLAVELIALSEVEAKDWLYGVITLGDLWKFARLDRKKQEIFQDVDSFRVPKDLAELMGGLIGILEL